MDARMTPQGETKLTLYTDDGAWLTSDTWVDVVESR